MSETATITLSNASNASISDSTATLTITDDDLVQIGSDIDGEAANDYSSNSDTVENGALAISNDGTCSNRC